MADRTAPPDGKASKLERVEGMLDTMQRFTRTQLERVTRGECSSIAVRIELEWNMNDGGHLLTFVDEHGREDDGETQ